MDERDLAVDQLADQDVGALSDCFGRQENLLTLGVAPPATPDRAASDRLRKAWDRSSRSLKNNSVMLDECQSLFRSHFTPRFR